MIGFAPVIHELRLGKLVAAARLTEFAINALQCGDYDVAITLAGAADGMLPEVPGQEFFSALRLHPTALSHFTPKESTEILNWERNWLKHPTPNLPEDISIEIDAAGYMILRALTKIPEWSDRMEVIKTWYIAHRTGAAG